MRSTPVVVGLLILVGLLWIGGELHRSNCIRQGRVACSVLPWDQGTTKARQIQQRRRGGGVVYSSGNRGTYGNPLPDGRRLGESTSAMWSRTRLGL